MMKKLLKDLHNRLYEEKPILISIESKGLSATMTFKFYDYQFYDDNRTIELRALDDTIFTININEIKACIPYEDEAESNYRIETESWNADISFI